LWSVEIRIRTTSLLSAFGWRFLGVFAIDHNVAQL
jgi:hypothetical protein